MKIKRALISVSDKTGIVEFAQALSALGVELISTGGTYKVIKAAGVPVTYVTEVTGFPEILDGRVKTLNPRIHGGILARRTPEHLQQLAEHDITPIDLVCVNLYPFKETISKPDVTLAAAIENIDIGGPAMVRAAAKNYEGVVILVNPENYEAVLTQLKQTGDVEQSLRLKLAAAAFTHTAQYDGLISTYLTGLVEPQLPKALAINYVKQQELRYGENPHQQAAFYGDPQVTGPNVANAEQLQGKELSFNNIIDANAAFELVREFEQPACVIIKHTNPCGTAVGQNLVTAYQRAFAADSVSAFGGIAGLNRTVDQATAAELVKTFMEVVIAPDFEQDALAVLASKSNLRLLKTGPLTANLPKQYDLKKVNGGLLVQEVDTGSVTAEQLQIVTKAQPDEALVAELLFAWKVVKHVKSNAIVVAKDGVTLGVGAGQMNRVGSAKLAFEQAAAEADGAVLASDAFFPFKDSIEEAARAGIKAIIQPGGSMRDDEVIAAADEHGIVMVFTGMRHFKH